VPAGEALLDEALKETFPASDPISPSAAPDDAAGVPAIPAAPAPPPPPSDAPIPFPTAEGAAATGGVKGARRAPRRRRRWRALGCPAGVNKHRL
jgi:hypothetical protein